MTKQTKTQRVDKPVSKKSPNGTEREPADQSPVEHDSTVKSSAGQISVIPACVIGGTLQESRIDFQGALGGKFYTKPGKPVKTTGCPELDIDKDICAVLDPLTPDEYAKLESSILEKRQIREAIVVWKVKAHGKLKRIIVDGHHRYSVCKKHGIKPKIEVMSFASKVAAKVWLLENQVGRRNMTEFQKIEATLKLKEVYVAQAKQNQRAGGGAVRQKSDKPLRVDEMLGERVGVSRSRIRESEYVLKHASKEDIDTLRRGEAKIHTVYEKYRNAPQAATASTKSGTVSTKPSSALSQKAKNVFQPFETSITKAFPKLADRVHAYDVLITWANQRKKQLQQKKGGKTTA